MDLGVSRDMTVTVRGIRSPATARRLPRVLETSIGREGLPRNEPLGSPQGGVPSCLRVCLPMASSWALQEVVAVAPSIPLGAWPDVGRAPFVSFSRLRSSYIAFVMCTHPPD